MKNWFRPSYKSLRETVTFLNKKRKEKEEEILIKMQISCSFPDTMREIEDIFRHNPHLKLHRFKPFRAWYKHYKEWEKKDPEHYARLLEAGMTPHEDDPYFDPNAPDWEQYENRRVYYDNYSDDISGNTGSTLKKAAEDGFIMGIGMGIADDIIND